MPRHKFRPGNKFGGRKPIPEDVKEIARAATPRAIQRQIELMESKDENVALKATNAVLDRAFGKPAQTLNTDLGRRDLLEYSMPSWSPLPMGVGLVGRRSKALLKNESLVRLRRSSSGLFCRLA